MSTITVSPVNMSNVQPVATVYPHDHVVPVCASPRRTVSTATSCSSRMVPRTVRKTAYVPTEVCETVMDKETTCVTREEACPTPCAEPCEKPCDPCETYGWGSNFWTFFIIWVVVTIVVALILWAVKPSWVLNKDANGQPIAGSVNAGQLILWSVLIGLVVGIIIWLLWTCVC